MKKVYLFLLALVTIAIGARAQLVKVGSGQVAKVTVGDTIQSLDSLKKAVEDTTQLFVIQNYGDAHDSHAAFYQESATASEGINAFTATADQRTLVKLKKLTDSTYTIQAYSGRYYATSGGNQQSVNTADTASTFVIRAANTGTTLANGFRVFSNNTYLNTTGSSPNKKPIWNTTTGTGNYSIIRIYKAGYTLENDSLVGKKVSVADSATANLSTGKWYLMAGYQQSSGTQNRYVYYTDNGTAVYNVKTGFRVTTTSPFATNSVVTTTSEAYLIRLQNAGNGNDSTYYIQTASGKYFGQLQTNENKNPQTTLQCSATGVAYKFKKVNAANPTYFAIQCDSNNVTLCNNSNPNNNLVGWGTTVPTSTSGNNIWRFYEVTIGDNVTPTPEPTPEPSPEPTPSDTTVIGKYVSVAGTASTSFSDDKWYMMAGYQDNQTANRYVYYTTSGKSVYGSTVGFRVTTTSPFASGNVKATTGNADYIFRVVKAGTDSTYNIQTATGKYFAELHNNASGNQTLNCDSVGHAYVIKAYKDGYVTVRCGSNNVVLMNNSGNNNNVVGWGTGNPSKTPNNDVWKFFEVTLTDSVVIPTPEPEPVVNSTAVKVTTDAATSIDTTKWYMIAGYQDNNGSNKRYVYYSTNGSNYGSVTTGFNVTTTSPFLGDSVKASTANMDYLFRFVPAGTDSTYYVQTATGKFFAELHDNSKGGSPQRLQSSTTPVAYTVKAYQSGSNYFTFRCTSNSVLLHNNSGNPGTVVGWNTGTANKTPSNNVWQLFETSYQNNSLPTPTPEPEPEPTPLPEPVDSLISGKIVSVTTIASEQLSEGKWYMMAGYQKDKAEDRFVYYTDNGYNYGGSTKGFYVNTTSPFSGGNVKADSVNMNYLFRLVKAGNDSTYYLQNAAGKYFGTLHDNATGSQQQLRTSDTPAKFIIKSYRDGYYTVRCQSNRVILMNNGAPNNTVVGWATGNAGHTPENNVWKFFEATLYSDSTRTPEGDYVYTLRIFGSQPERVNYTMGDSAFRQTDLGLTATVRKECTINDFKLEVKSNETYSYYAKIEGNLINLIYLNKETLTDTVSSKYVVVSGEPVTTFSTDKWYMISGYQLNNSQKRYVYYTSNGPAVYGVNTGFRVSTDNPFENGTTQVTADNKSYLFRFIPVKGQANQCYIQSANGQYFADLQDNQTLAKNPVTLQGTDKGYPYLLQTFNSAQYPAYFAVYCTHNHVMLHNNTTPANNVVGFDTGLPVLVPNNNVWQFFEVSLTDEIVGINSASIDINDAGGYNPNAPAYNLQGQRVGNGYKGIVIQGGKKYIVK